MPKRKTTTVTKQAGTADTAQDSSKLRRLQIEAQALESEHFRLTMKLTVGMFDKSHKWKPWERKKLENRLAECYWEIQNKRLQLLNSWLRECSKPKLSWIPKGGYNVF